MYNAFAERSRSSAERLQNVERRGIPPPGPRKTLTYQDQLRALQPDKQQYKSHRRAASPGNN